MKQQVDTTQQGIPQIYIDNWVAAETNPSLFVETYISPDLSKPYMPTFEQNRFMNAMLSGNYEEGWFAGGNSAGKTWCGKFIATMFAAYKIKPGKPWNSYEEFMETPYNILCTGPENKQAIELWEAIEMSFKNSPYLRHMVKEVHTGTRRNIHPHIVLDNGVIIEAIGLGEKGKHVEGQAYDLILVNEPADVKHFIHCLNKVLIPRTWRRGGVNMGFGTPKGKNEYYMIWRRGQKELNGTPNPHYEPRVYSQYADSRTNPHAAQEKIAQMLELDDETLIAERIRGEFVDSTFMAFKDSHIEKLIMEDSPVSIAPKPGHTYIHGLDFGRKNDYTVCITMDVSVKPHEVVNYYRAGGGHTTWESIFDSILTIAREYDGEFMIDATGMAGDMQSNYMADLNLKYTPFNFAGQAHKKASLINDLQDAIAKKKFVMPYIEQLLEELHMYPGDFKDEGMVTDSVIALALCLQGVKTFANVGYIEEYNR